MQLRIRELTIVAVAQVLRGELDVTAEMADAAELYANQRNTRVKLHTPWRDGVSKARKMSLSLSSRLPAAAFERPQLKDEYCRSVLELVRVSTRALQAQALKDSAS
jgi:hypothetical protein